MSIQITPGIVKPKPDPWQEPGWIDRIVEHPSELESALRAVGIGNAAGLKPELDKVFAGLISRFPEDFAPVGEHHPRRPEARAALFEGIKEIFTGLKKVEEQSEIITQELPLCIFDSPKASNSKTTFAQTKITEATGGWNIEVLGSGAGSDITISVTESSEFASTNGERKLMFVPLQIKVVQVALYKRGVLQQKFLKAELYEPKVRNANGLRSVAEDEWSRLVKTGKPIDRFDLSGDKSGDISKYRREYELAGHFEVKIGFKAFSIDSKVTAKLSAKEKASMTFDLPAGRVYELLQPASIAGFYFGNK